MTFKRLTDAEVERLAMLTEDAAKIIAAAQKILRHGYDSGAPTANREHLRVAVVDLLAGVRMMHRGDDIASIDETTQNLAWLRKVLSSRLQRGVGASQTIGS